MKIRPISVIVLMAGLVLPGQASARPLQTGVSGRVYDAAGAPYGGGCIVAIDERGDEVAEASTDSGGNYLIEILRPGDYRIRFEDCPDWNIPKPPHVPVWYATARTLSQAVPVRVDFGRVTDGIDARLELGATISGTVRSPSGRALRGVRVEAVKVGASPTSKSGGLWTTTSETDDAGRYEIARLDTGEYRLVAGNSNFVTWPDVRYHGRSWYGGGSGTSIFVERSQNLSGYDITAIDVPAPIATGRAATAIGRIMAADISLVDTGQRTGRTPSEGGQTNAPWELPFSPMGGTGTAGRGNSSVWPRPGGVSATAVIGAFGAAGLRVSADVDCVDGVTIQTKLDRNFLDSLANDLPEQIPPNTTLTIRGWELTLNYQKVEQHSVEAAAVRFVDELGQVAMLGYVQASLNGCP